MVEELYTSEQLAQMHSSLWECVLQFANFSATQERNRIARELHDSLGHILTGLNLQLQTAIKLCQIDSTQAREFLAEAHSLATIATQEVRQSVKGLRSNTLQTQSLQELIEVLVNDFHKTTGILPEVEIDTGIAMSQQFVIPVYRIIQEALNNIRKYAKASEVKINLRITCKEIHLQIKDNGCGFDLEQVRGGYGLQGMQERVAVIRGNFHLESQPGAGCCISVEIPMHLPQISTENYISEFPQMDKIPEIPITPKFSDPKVNKLVKISEWQPFKFNQWQELTYL